MQNLYINESSKRGKDVIEYKLSKFDEKLSETENKIKKNEEQLEEIIRKTGYDSSFLQKTKLPPTPY